MSKPTKRSGGSSSAAKRRKPQSESLLNLSRELQERISRPFAQSSGDLALAGTGLGLAIARQVVQMMGGTIDAELGATLSKLAETFNYPAIQNALQD